MAASDEEGEFQDLESLYFDSIVGCIEDIIISDEFTAMQHSFFNQHCSLFDYGEENKLIYTDVFNRYTQMIELYLESKLKIRIPTFKMDQFVEDLRRRKHSLDGEVFEILSVYTDFISFKEMILDFKTAKEGLGNDLMLCGSRLNM